MERSRNIKYILDIMERYPHGISRKKVFELSEKKPTEMLRSWRKLRKEAIIKKVGYGTFVLNKKGTLLSLDTAQKVNLHALQFSFPIIEDKSTNQVWDKFNEVKNWKGAIKRIDGITIKKNTKKVQAWLWAREVRDIDEISKISHSAAFKIAVYLYKIGVTVNIDEVSVNTKHVAIENTELEKMVPKGTKIEVSLNRLCEKVFEEDKDEPAKAWVDDSPFKAIETNDIKYARDVLMMPEYIKAVNKALDGLVIHWNTHLPLMQHTDATMVVMQKTMEEMQKAIQELRDAIKEGKK